MKTTAYGICYGQQEQAEHSTITRSQRAICARLDRQCADGPAINNDDGGVVHTTTMETSAGTTTFPSVRTPVIVTHSMSMLSMGADNLVPDTGNN